MLASLLNVRPETLYEKVALARYKAQLEEPKAIALTRYRLVVATPAHEVKTLAIKGDEIVYDAGWADSSDITVLEAAFLSLARKPRWRSMDDADTSGVKVLLRFKELPGSIASPRGLPRDYLLASYHETSKLWDPGHGPARYATELFDGWCPVPGLDEDVE